MQAYSEHPGNARYTKKFNQKNMIKKHYTYVAFAKTGHYFGFAKKIRCTLILV
jgi:hypothetical protein